MNPTETVLREALAEAADVPPTPGDPWERVARAHGRSRAARRSAGAALLVAAVAAGTVTATRPWADPAPPPPSTRPTQRQAVREGITDAELTQALRGARGPRAAPSEALRASAREAIGDLLAELRTTPAQAPPRVLWIGRVPDPDGADGDDAMVAVTAGHRLLARGLTAGATTWEHRAAWPAEAEGGTTAWRVPIGGGDAVAWLSPAEGKVVVADAGSTGLASADEGGWIRARRGARVTVQVLDGGRATGVEVGG